MSKGGSILKANNSARDASQKNCKFQFKQQIPWIFLTVASFMVNEWRTNDKLH